MSKTLFKAIKDIVSPQEVLMINPKDFDTIFCYSENTKATVIQSEYKFYTDYKNLTVETVHPYYSYIPKNQLYYKIIHFSKIDTANELYQLLDLFKNNLTHEGIYVIEDGFNINSNDKTKAVYDWLNKHEDMTVLLTGFNTIILSSKLNYKLYDKAIKTNLAKAFDKPVNVIENNWINSGLTISEVTDFDYDYNNESIPKIVDLAFKYFAINSVLDVGCGKGNFLKEFKNRGVKTVFGVDGLDKTDLPFTEYKKLDLNEKFDVGKFDLTVCLEVAEHIKEENANKLIESLTNSSNFILFSAAIPNQPGPGHINCQWPTYWRDKFKQYGYVMIDLFRPSIWEDKSINWWYRQNMFLVVKEGYEEAYCYEDQGIPPVLNLVHPEANF